MRSLGFYPSNVKCKNTMLFWIMKTVVKIGTIYKTEERTSKLQVYKPLKTRSVSNIGKFDSGTVLKFLF